MKRLFAFLLAVTFVLPLVSCTDKYLTADEYSRNYLSAFLVRDEEEMKKYIHPDHIESVLPDDEFYKALEEQYLTVGHELTNLSGVDKIKLDDPDGAIKCTYVARINELFYTVEMIIIDDDNGYGIASFAIVFNNNFEYYFPEYVSEL
ncbi:MAG: hypothetical protein E7595_03580 [Ruminococcaceae bacterium]|nr:hypothetical protein [Oscillospiraceae bacterium]